MGVPAYPDAQMVQSELDFHSDDNAEIKQLARFRNAGSNGIPYPEASSAAAVAIDQAVPVELVSRPAASLASDVKITKIDIITKQSKFEALKTALHEIGITGMTVTQVLGCGMQKGKTEYYRGVETEVNLLPKVQIEIVVSKVPVRSVIETAKNVPLYGQHRRRQDLCL